ncbi:Nucleoside diphosphate kinase [Toxocara canis]|uniref:nucleoside-diphosphate kinase n=1 Tax=Toxocara canis TaxID=6265 RepID=A0A0B2VWB5_TOXCA|nr:Nucleoside diphosphate kinase [Toxocara canis]
MREKLDTSTRQHYFTHCSNATPHNAYFYPFIQHNRLHVGRHDVNSVQLYAKFYFHYSLLCFLSRRTLGNEVQRTSKQAMRWSGCWDIVASGRKYKSNECVMLRSPKISSIMWKALCQCRRNKVKEEEIAIANTIDFTSKTGEKTIVIFAGAVIQRALIGKLIERIERRNLSLDGVKMLRPTTEMLQIHFKGRPNIGSQKAIAERIETMLKSPIIVSVWRGVDAVKACANVCSELRHQFALELASLSNSESAQQARKDIARWFRLDEISSVQHAKVVVENTPVDEVDSQQVEEGQPQAEAEPNAAPGTDNVAETAGTAELQPEQEASKEDNDQKTMEEANIVECKIWLKTTNSAQYVHMKSAFQSSRAKDARISCVRYTLFFVCVTVYSDSRL